MSTERHLIIYATTTKRAVIDVLDLRVTKNTGIPKRVIDRIIKTLDDKNLSLIRWMKAVSK